MGYAEEAVKKLEEELGSGKYDRYGQAMKKDVCKALIDFCRQDEEFAQAVCQGGSFEDCMKAVAKGVANNAISDMKAYGAAVSYYFPGAAIDVRMSIDLSASARQGAAETPKKKGVLLDLSKFF